MTKVIKNPKTPRSNKTPVSLESPRASDIVSWRLSACDRSMWPLFDSGNLSPEEFQNTIIPFLVETEKNSWSYWLTKRKKKCHELKIEDLNKCARDRLEDLCIEVEKMLVLHLENTHCLYGYIIGGICYLLWYDIDHGDNDKCVCRSFKKGDKKKHQK